MRRAVHGTSCPWGELSMGRAVHGASCPWGELSMGRAVQGASCLGASCHRRVLMREFRLGKFRWGESSGNHIRYCAEIFASSEVLQAVEEPACRVCRQFNPWFDSQPSRNISSRGGQHQQPTAIIGGCCGGATFDCYSESQQVGGGVGAVLGGGLPGVFIHLIRQASH
jgi:hypothetical protein